MQRREGGDFGTV
jgi:hypothetical protein